MSDSIQLLHGDCLDLMKGLPDGSVDMICADLPYGTTCCHWDVRIPMAPLWEQFWRVAKHNAAICMFAQQPFATDLINAARKWFRYEWVWIKSKALGYLNANKMPLRKHELILTFYRKLPVYNAQRWDGNGLRDKKRNPIRVQYYGKNQNQNNVYRGGRFPVDTLYCASRNDSSGTTEKPIALLEILVKTYTNAGELVLDPTMGSGSCGVACVNAGRRFVGMEKDAHFFEVAQRRIREAADRKQTQTQREATDVKTTEDEP